MNELVKQYMEAADLLINQGYYRQGINLSWIALRTSIFDFLKSKQISYNNTREALLKFIQFSDNPINSNIWFLESIATLSEWDINFSINESESKDYYAQCLASIKQIWHIL